MMAFRPIALILALFVISSCAYAPGNSVFSRGRCNVNASEHLQGVDWSTAQKLNLRIRQGDFVPAFLGLFMGRPYVLSIENADDSTHSFRAMEFFTAVAVAGVRVNGGEFEKVQCLDGVTIPPINKTEIRFVAVRDGSYEFEDNSLMMSMAMIGSAGGFITIEAPRTLSDSPLQHLKLFERVPIPLTRDEPKPTGLFDDQEEEPAPSPGLFDDQKDEPPAEPPSGLFDDQEEPPAEPPSGLFDDREEPPAEPPSGLFDDNEEPPAEPPSGLFDDGEAPPAEPPRGLFDDDRPEQPIEASPSLPVETQPPSPEQTDEDPDKNLFGEPVQEPTPEQPEAVPPIVDITPEMPSDDPVKSLFESDPEEEFFMEEEPTEEAVPEKLEAEPIDPEEEFFVKDESDVVAPPESPDAKLDDSEQSPGVMDVVTTEPQPQLPAITPDGFMPLEGPPATLYSDPPDVVIKGPGAGGDSGNDQFDNSG